MRKDSDGRWEGRPASFPSSVGASTFQVCARPASCALPSRAHEPGLPSLPGGKEGTSFLACGSIGPLLNSPSGHCVLMVWGPVQGLLPSLLTAVPNRLWRLASCLSWSRGEVLLGSCYSCRNRLQCWWLSVLQLQHHGAWSISGCFAGGPGTVQAPPPPPAQQLWTCSPSHPWLKRTLARASLSTDPGVCIAGGTSTSGPSTSTSSPRPLPLGAVTETWKSPAPRLSTCSWTSAKG